MIRTPRFFALLILFALTAGIATAQVPTGTPPFGSYGGGPDVINLANLNAHISIPVIQRPGRGMKFSYVLSYDTSVWYPAGASGYQSWQPVISFGWSGQTAPSSGYLTYEISLNSGSCVDYNGNHFFYNGYHNWNYQDPVNISHSFGGEFYVFSRSQPPGLTPDCIGGPGSQSSIIVTAADGSGLTLSTGAPNGVFYDYIVTSKGAVITPPVNTQAGSAVATDRNGNQINVSTSGAYTDTLGTTPLTVAGSGTPSSPLTYTLTAPSGASPQYKMIYTAYTVQTKFGCSGVSEYGPTSVNLVSEIDLPDYNASTNPNARYTFGYEGTPGVSGNVTGRVASVTLPTGGTISYAYSGGGTGVNGITCADGSAATLTRTTPDGTWTYAQVKNTGAASTTTVTDPQGNDTVIQFQGTYETQRQAYQGSHTSGTLLLTTNTCYNGSASPCTGTAVPLPFTQKSVITILSGANNLQSKQVTLFDSYGNTSELDEYDFGSGAPPSTPLRKTVYTYASLGNIHALPASVKVENGSGTTVAQATYAYDETAVTTTTGTPQQTSVTGSRGNLTTLKTYTTSSNYLTKKMTYFDTGNVQTVTDVNNGQTTYTYGACGNSFATSVAEAVSGLTQSIAWNCTGAVQTSATDENGKIITTSYTTDHYYWRPESTSDPTGATANFCYGLITSGTCNINPNQTESTLNFNSGNSVADTLTTLDGLGRAHLQQTRQSPNSSNFDSGEADFDPLGRANRSTLPFTAAAGQTSSSAPATTTTYDALGRPLTVTDAGNGTASYTYTQNDVYISAGPAPSGENPKRRQLEYDGLGRLTSVCEVTSLSGNGTCGQSSSQTGYWTKYTYDLLNNLTGVTQNAQAASGSQQSRTYVFDFLSRVTSETNAESGTTSYTYDSATGCTGTYSGDLVKRVDVVGNTTCYTYDALHRKLSATYPSGSYASVTPSKYFVYDTATVNSVPMTNVKSRVAEAYTCFSPCSSKTTDIGFSYTVRDEVSDVYQMTPHSSPSYYHVSQTYWPHGVPSQLSSGITGLPTISYGGTIGSTVGLDGEGRITQVTASGTGQQNPVTGVTYNNSSLPTQVTFGSADTDIFAYDANTMRMTQYQFNINGQSSTGAVTWNANSSLQKLVVTDAFNSADNQTCNYAHDDLSRIAQADCGTGGWGQSFGYDPFGNITKNVLTNHTGNSFQPTYSSATNQFSSIPGASVSYDANGNVLTDGSHTYAWDANGNSISLDGMGLTFDALDRMVEQNRSGTYTEIVYSPGGAKLALMSGTGGQTLQNAFVPLPGQATAVYTSSGLDHYRHSDWLGSARLTSSPTRTVLSTAAYAPFGETYAQSGTADLSSTGQNQDTVSGDYDFLYREYSNQGRWPSPDPAGLASVNPAYPQSWNRYAYVLNNPLGLVDRFGLDCVYLDNNGGTDPNGDGGASIDHVSDEGGCQESGGYWANGYVPSFDYVQTDPNSDLLLITSDIGGQWGLSLAGSFNNGGVAFTWGAFFPGEVPTAYFTSFTAWPVTRVANRGTPTITGAGGSNGGATLDARTNALANAINNTRVQSLVNPCTIGAFYGASAVLGFGGGAAAGGEAAEAATAVKAASSPYWPMAFRWLYNQANVGFAPLIRGLNKTASAVQGACDAAQ